mgnify:CR=1 FL=1
MTCPSAIPGANMSDVFFKELGIPEPNINLGISELNHGAMTGRMLEKLEAVMIKESIKSSEYYR